MRRLVALVFVVLLVGGCAGDPARPARREDRLPDVSLASLTGGPAVDLGALRGPAVVNLWAQWCTPCKRELPIYQQFWARHGTTVPVLGIDWQDIQPGAARALARKSGAAYPLVVDSIPEIRAQALPRLLLVDRQGRIAFQEYVEIKSLAQLEQLVEQHLGVTL